MICKKCGVDKLETEFYRRSDNGKLYKICKKCCQEDQKGYIQNYRQRHKKQYREQQNKYNRERRSIDPIYKLITNMRNRTVQAVKNNTRPDHTMKLFGCTGPELKTYLESKFQPEMTWENYGHNGWHIDHIRPIVSFDLSNSEEQRKCFHYTNLQPLWAMENLKKGKNIIPLGGI